MRKILSVLLVLLFVCSLAACSQKENNDDTTVSTEDNSLEVMEVEIPEDFVLIQGGTFQMGSPESEAWRSADETQHTVTVSDFYMSKYELTQKEYEKISLHSIGRFRSDLLQGRARSVGAEQRFSRIYQLRQEHGVQQHEKLLHARQRVGDRQRGQG